MSHHIFTSYTLQWKYFDRLYDLYNNEAFEGCLPTNMEIKWDSRLTKTAGTCSQAGKLDRKTGTYTERKSSINLSIKVNSKVIIV